METMNITLSPEINEFVQNEVNRGGYNDTSDYIRTLILEDQHRKEKEQLEILLIDGINSGPATEMTKEDWNQLKQGVEDHLNKQHTIK